MKHKLIVKTAAVFMFVQLLVSCEQQKNTNNVTEETPVSDAIIIKEIKEVAVYTTSSNSDVKLQLTDANIPFSAFKQPLETEASIYVNTNKQHQTLLGIGAALTDAVAETFYK